MKIKLLSEARRLHSAKCLLYQGWEEARTGDGMPGQVTTMSNALHYITKQADAAMSAYLDAPEDRAEYLR